MTKGRALFLLAEFFRESVIDCAENVEGYFDSPEDFEAVGEFVDEIRAAHGAGGIAGDRT
jgi:hypothetical protein